MGDRVAVLDRGVLQQCATPKDLFTDPVNRFVAGFIGSPQMNLLEATVTEAGATYGSLTVPLTPEQRAGLHGSTVTLGVRPEDWRLESDGGLEMQVAVVEELGSEAYLYGSDPSADAVTDKPLVARAEGLGATRAGDHVHLVPRAGPRARLRRRHGRPGLGRALGLGDRLLVRTCVVGVRGVVGATTRRRLLLPRPPPRRHGGSGPRSRHPRRPRCRRAPRRRCRRRARRRGRRWPRRWPRSRRSRCWGRPARRRTPAHAASCEWRSGSRHRPPSGRSTPTGSSAARPARRPRRCAGPRPRSDRCRSRARRPPAVGRRPT